MQVTKESTTPTTIKLTFSGEAAELDQIKQGVLKRLSGTVKMQGFREGKAPLNLVEKNLDPNVLQQEFLETAVNDLYVRVIDQEKIRPVAQPSISISKFVPFNTLEVVAEVEAVGEVKLGEYKKLGVVKQPSKVTEEQIDNVVSDLRKKVATRKDVDRAAKDGDEVIIDFSGTDPETKESIDGASGQDYPLVLGSGNFIPGFEEELVGLKADADKTFDITFPKDYGAKGLQGKKVTFKVTVKKVQQMVEPKVDDAFAATIGNFKTVAELRTDIRRELENQANQEVQRQYDNELIEAIAKKTKVALPKALVDEELDRLEEQERQSIIYRGQTWQEHLDEEGVTDEEHREKNREGAELRVKSGIILGEIADAEGVKVTPEELEIRIQLLRGQYATDERMQQELEKPENRRDILSRLMTEKTLDKLKSLQ